MLFRNKTIEDIKYSLSNEKNISRFRFYLRYKKLPHKEIESIMRSKDDHHVQEMSWKQKICLPLWCWKSFIHDKHEAFRFKYDTNALLMLED